LFENLQGKLTQEKDTECLETLSNQEADWMAKLEEKKKRKAVFKDMDIPRKRVDPKNVPFDKLQFEEVLRKNKVLRKK
jgi:hypothetical protein